MSYAIESYLADVQRTLRTDAERKRRIVDELRAHLEEKTDAIHREEPTLTRDEAAQRALAGFGEARDLALAYEPDGAVLRNAAGETVLHLGRALGRGAGTFLKWTGVAVGGLVLVALLLGVWAWYEVVPIAEERFREWSPYPVFSHHEDCEDVAACSAAPVSQRFFVHADAKDVRMTVRGSHASGGAGTVHLTVRDPSGNTKYDRTFTAAEAGRFRDEVVWDTRSGEWTVTWQYTGFVGSFDVEIATTGLPR